MWPNPSGKVRIVARIKGQSKKEAETLDGSSSSTSKQQQQPWISVSRPDEQSNSYSSGRVKISFGSDQTTSGKQCYELDECYEQDVGNEGIFCKEIKPLISGLFGGQSSTVFAYGPRSSGKTYTIQGCEEEPGLAVLTMDSILPRAEEEGKFVTISVFEVFQDRVIDLLDSKRPEVSVFEDGQGKIRLKGLSKVKVNSTSEFQTLFFRATNIHKPSQKILTDSPHRSHIGCIIHVVSPQTENSKVQLVGKINFIDLASYEDSRRKSSEGTSLSETTRVNKTLYAVHKVLSALVANEARVPYRESKLTRMLQDSLGGVNKVLMVSCMNSSVCQETVQTISLASRSCLAGFLACLDPGKSGRSGTKTVGSSPQAPKSASKTAVRASVIRSSPQVLKSASKATVRASMLSPRVMKPMTMSASASGKKQTGSQLRMSVKKPSAVDFEAKRKLFDEANQLKNYEHESKIRRVSPDKSKFTDMQDNSSLADSASATESSEQTEEVNLSQVASETTFECSPIEEERSASKASEDVDSSQLPPTEDVALAEVNDVTATPIAYRTPTTGNFLLGDKENRNLLTNENSSPPLSARLLELSNNLKSLCVSTESTLKTWKNTSTYCDKVINEDLEPKTPNLQLITRGDDYRHELANTKSPWESFHMRGSGMKDSFVQEYLRFLNTASKEELKALKGIGEKRATYILEKREESPEPFKKLDDLQDIGLSAKQIKGLMKNVAGDLFG